MVEKGRVFEKKGPFDVPFSAVLACAALLSVKFLAARGDSHSTTDCTDDTDALIAVFFTFVVSVESVV